MDIKKKLSEKIRRKHAEPEPAPVPTPIVPAFPFSKTPPPIVMFNINESNPPESFLLVEGEYNAHLAKGFSVSVVGLSEWHPSFRARFANAKRIEVVISRVPHGVKPNPEFAQAAAKSASVEANLQFLRSIAADEWIRERCVVSNDGVFEMARLRRQFGNDPMARGAYLKNFVAFPTDIDDLTQLCTPPPKPQKILQTPDMSLYWDYGVNPVAPSLVEAPGSGGRDTRRGDLEFQRAMAAARKEAEAEIDFADKLGWNAAPSAEVLESLKDWNKP